MGHTRIEELAAVLSRERRLLEFLLFKLTAARLLLEDEEHRFLPWAATEVQRAAQRVREVELIRGTLVSSAGELTLAELAAQSEEPWRDLLGEQRRDLVQLLGEITSVTDVNRALAFDGIRSVAELMEMIELGLGAAPAEPVS